MSYWVLLHGAADFIDTKCDLAEVSSSGAAEFRRSTSDGERGLIDRTGIICAFAPGVWYSFEWKAKPTPDQ